MSFSDHASERYPGVEWTGGSGIHVSFAVSQTIPISANQRGKILALLNSAQWPFAIWRYIQQRVGNMEFLMDQNTFCNLMLIDMDRRMQGKPTLSSPDRIKNPATGNLFHRIALDKPYVGAVRFWAVPNGDGGTEIGFRFRIVSLKSDEEDPVVREEARVRAEQVQQEVGEVYETLMDVAEPPAHEVQTVKVMIKQLED